MSWAQSLTRMNTATMAVFGDATAVIDGGSAVPVVFDEGAAVGQVGYSGMATTEPSITLAATDVPANPVGKPVLVTPATGGARSFVVELAEPDSSGLCRLVLGKW